MKPRLQAFLAQRGLELSGLHCLRTRHTQLPSRNSRVSHAA